VIVTSEITNVLLYALAEEQFALPMSDVREVLRWRVPTPIPGTPQAILGVIHHHGLVLPVIDIRSLLGLATAAPARGTRLLVVEHDNIQAALVSDLVSDIVEVENTVIEPPPSSLPAAQAHFLTGLFFSAGRPVALLSLSATFAAVTSNYAS
jgi:purine-binding chemotaxis protein CheW